MKTKHLFFATALVASFASCTNDDIVEMQQGSNVERPTVDNVQLNFVAEGVDSRLTFGSNGYAWEADDVIGALNMDQPVVGADSKAPWYGKYALTSFINTSYPFTYDAEAGTWGTPGKMLEGNYFFAFPFTDYEGERYAKYTLTEQQQTGIKGAVVAKNYAENQVFVGYSPIKKGTGFDMLTDIEMTSLLGAVQLRIVNEGTKTYHINKIVINGDKVVSGFELNPIGENIDHKYNEYSVTVESTTTKYEEFYPANYLGKDFEGEEVADVVLTDIEEEEFAENRMAALRDVANFNGTNKFVQLFVNGTEEERALTVKGTAYALIMVNPYQYYTTDADGDFTKTETTEWADVAEGKLTATIYTDEGVISNVNLLNTTDEDYKAQGYVKSTEPGVANTIVITITDKDVEEMNELEVYSQEDLLQLVSWNAKAAKKTTLYATLKEDVTLTKKVMNVLKSNEKLTLKISNANGGTKTLTLAADLTAEDLAWEGLSILSKDDQTVNGAPCDKVPVKVAGEMSIVKETVDMPSIEVLENAILNINVLNANVPAVVIVDEDATLNIGAAAKTSANVEIENNGEMNVAAGALVQGPIANNAELNLNGTANRVVNEGIVNMGATSKIMSGTNTAANNENAIINMVSGATLTNINNGTGETAAGNVKYVDGAIITYTGTGANRATTVKGTVFVEVADKTVAADTYKEKGVNLWKLTGDINVTAGATLSNVEIAEEAAVVITVAADSTLTIGTMTVPENASVSTNGIIKFTNVVVKEDGEWVNNGKAIVQASLINYGVIYNNGVAQHGTAANDTYLVTLKNVVYQVEAGTALTDKMVEGSTGVWKNNNFMQYYVAARTAKQQAMDKLVEFWASMWEGLLENYPNVYNGNPYDYKALLTGVQSWGDQDVVKNMTTAGFTAAQLTIAADGTVSEPSEFAEAVKYVLGEDEEEAASAALINPSTHTTAPGEFTTEAVSYLGNKQTIIFENATAVSHFVASLVNTKEAVNNEDLFNGNAKNAAAAWDLTLTTAINTTSTTKWNYIAEGDSIYEAARIWALHSGRISDRNLAARKSLYVAEGDGTLSQSDGSSVATTNNNNVERLKAFVDYLSNIKSSDKTDAQTDAYTAISPYKEFIFKLVNDGCEYTADQINACVAHDEDAARIEYGFEIED